jgi:PEP-CTERM motif
MQEVLEMMFIRKTALLLTFLSVLWLAAPAAKADTIVLSSQGTFIADNDRPEFTFSLLTTSTLTFSTYSYNGGTNAQGMFISPGGFDPILTLFDADGIFIREFVNPTGPGDISEMFMLDIGNYTLVITQFDNFAVGNLADGFIYDGDPAFTSRFAAGGGGAHAPFVDVNGNQRNGNYAFDVTIQGGSPEPVPEPATLLLLATGIVGASSVALKRRKATKN